MKTTNTLHKRPRGLLVLLLALLLTAPLAAEEFVGTWETSYGTMYLFLDGYYMAGYYSGDSEGVLLGFFNEENMKAFLLWYEPDNGYGRAEFTFDPRTRDFSGTWGAEESSEDGDVWEGSFISEEVPDEVKNSLSGAWNASNNGELELTTFEGFAFGLVEHSKGSPFVLAGLGDAREVTFLWVDYFVDFDWLYEPQWGMGTLKLNGSNLALSAGLEARLSGYVTLSLRARR